MSDRTVFFGFVKTPFGTFQIAATEQGLVRIHFPNRHIARLQLKEVPSRAKTILKRSKLFLRSFFSGKRYFQKPIPIDWRFFTSFDRRVLETLNKISSSTTISYSALAKRAGVPRAARAVGNALNRNPIPIALSCHRVVRKDGTLGGYGNGIRWKKVLLSLEKKSKIDPRS